MNTNELIEKRKSQLNLILNWTKSTSKNPTNNHSIITSSTTGSLVSTQDSPNLSPVNSNSSSTSSSSTFSSNSIMQNSLTCLGNVEDDLSEQTLLLQNTINKLNTNNNNANTQLTRCSVSPIAKINDNNEENSISIFDSLNDENLIKSNNDNNNNFEKVKLCLKY